MAKLVQKSGYIKSGKASGYMRYIATREGVEKLAGNGSVTKGQRELIQKLLTDFPDAVELFEYEDYCKTPTLGTASAFISMALDANLHEIDSESGYMQYIATRPRAQKRGIHFLFLSYFFLLTIRKPSYIRPLPSPDHYLPKIILMNCSAFPQLLQFRIIIELYCT